MTALVYASSLTTTPVMSLQHSPPSKFLEAKTYRSNMPPPPPPGRDISNPLVRKPRRCKGCHRYSDDGHSGVPMGATRCILPHSSKCVGGIEGGTDLRGREWKPCPPDYQGPSGATGLSGSESEHSDNEEEYLGSKEGNTDNESPVPSTTSTPTIPTLVCTTSVAMAHTAVTSSCQKPLTSISASDPIVEELAQLEQLKKQNAFLQEQVSLRDSQRISAERLEVQRQLKAEKDRMMELDRAMRSQRVSPGPEAEYLPQFMANMRSKVREQTEPSSFPSHYQGPTINDIRKIPEVRSRVEERLDNVRFDVPSLSRRPTANANCTSVGPQSKTRSAKSQGELGSSRQDWSGLSKAEQEFEQFKAWKNRNKFGPESDSDDSPPQVQVYPAAAAACSGEGDPVTEPSSSDEESYQPMILVCRRDKYGNKYRCYEPYRQVQKAHCEVSPVQYTWVTDPSTGRQYKQPVPKKSSSSPSNFKSKRQSPHYKGRNLSNQHVTLRSGGSREIRTPTTNTAATDHVPGIAPLEQREGKACDSKSLSIVDWARNCPIACAEKIKYEEINLPIWVWAYVSEILSSRSGMTPSLPKGELEARLQHLLCVLQVTMLHSDKADFNTKGWTMASIYAKRVQQKLDRGLESWSDFRRFGSDPHPSEMIAAKAEVDRKSFLKKKEDPVKVKPKQLCTTWNNCETENKCKYLLDNPAATKCNRRHDCSYCMEKGFGTFNHQRRFCRKRREAGDE